MTKELLQEGFMSGERKAPLNITQTDGEIYKYTTSIVKYPDVFHYTVNNAFISPYGMVFKNGFILNEATYENHKSFKNAFTFYKKIILGKIKRAEGNCVVIHNSWYDNYYHWCGEALPRLFVLKDKLKEIDLILPSDVKKFHRQTLEFFNINSITYCDDDELVFAPLLHFSSFTAKGFGDHNPELIRNMSSFLKNKMEPGGKFSHLKNIYTSRAATSKRKCINEDEVLELLKKYDFETVIPDQLSLQEQMELFSQAKNVLGVHGSSFVNCLYMKKDSVIFDLIETNHNDFCYFNMASALNVKYVYIRSNGVGDPKNFRNNDLVVDVKNLGNLLDKYLCR